MAETISITLAGWERLERAFAQAPDIVREELRRFAMGATMFLEGEVKDRTPQGAHGHLAQSITSEVSDLADGVLGVVGTPLAYAVPVELGTKPHMPPIQPLEDWVQHKLGKMGPEIKRVAYAIAWKIKHHGTKGAFMFKGAFEANQVEVRHQFEVSVARILQRIEGAGA
jgi:hypothetical protein